MVAFVGNIGDIGGVFVGDTEDIENVISDIQDIVNYVPLHKVESVLERSLKLLKEQEAVEPDTDSEGICSCGNCGETVGYYPVGCNVPERLCKFCPECGKAVQWDDCV